MDDVANLGLPPPLAHPHLAIHPFSVGFVREAFPWFVLKLVLKCRVRKEFPDAFNRVASPKIDCLGDHLFITVNSFPVN